MEPYVTDEAEEEARPDANANASNQASSIPEQEQLPPELPADEVPRPRVVVPRRDPTLPVRFASPVTSGDNVFISRRKPFRRTSRDRDQSPAERHDGRPGRGGSPLFGERERQTSSPSPIREFLGGKRRREVPARERSPSPVRDFLFEARRREGSTKRVRERSLSPVVDDTRDRRALRAAPASNKRDSYFSEEDTVYLPSYFERSRNPREAGRSYLSDDGEDYELDSRVRRGRAANPFSPYTGSRHIPATRAVPSRRLSDYYYEDEIDVGIRDGRPEMGRWPRARFEAPRTVPLQSRGTTRYDSDSDVEIRVRRSRDSPVREQTIESRYYPPPPGEPTNYFEDFDHRTKRKENYYPTPRVNFPGSYRGAPHSPPPPSRRRSTYNRDAEDVRFERERGKNPYGYYGTSTAPKYSPIRPSNDTYYRSAMSNRSRYGRSPPPPPPPTVAPVIINNRLYYDSDDDGNSRRPSRRRRARTKSRSRSRSAGSFPSPMPESIINHYRAYDDSEDEYSRVDRVDGSNLSLIRPSAYSRSRSRIQSRSHEPPIAPVIINNRIKDDYEVEYHGTKRWDEYDLGLVPQAYPFSLSRHSKSLQGAESVISTTSDLSDVFEKSPQDIQKSPKLKSEAGKTYEVLHSQYMGDGVIGGSHAVQLTLAPDLLHSPSKSSASVFRWVHFEDKTMDFDNFEHNTLSITGLTESETATIEKLLGRAKRTYDKPLQTSTKAKSRFMLPSFLQENVSVEKVPASSKARTISWLCMPYFCLEKYSAPSGLRASSHPMRTLLQARFALIQKDRDMKQAVWFLILDDSLIVSCARLPMKSLQGDFITTLPKNEVQPSLASPRVLVSTKSSLLWTLPIEECQSWFGFVSHFRDFWPLQVEVTLNEKTLTSSDWPRIIKLAGKTTVRLMVDFRAPKISEPVKGSLLFEYRPTKDTEDVSSAAGDHARTTPSLHPTDHKKPTHSQRIRSTLIKEEFHVFTWLNSRNGGPNIELNASEINVNFVLAGFESEGLQEDLTEMDNYLTKEINLNQRLLYNRSPESNGRADIYSRLLELKPDAASTEVHIIARYELLTGVLNAAELLYRFFLPPDYQAPTIPKFWGAFARLFRAMPEVKPSRSGMTSNRQSKFDGEASEVFDWLIQINNSTVPFKDYLSHVPLADRSSIKIPEELTRAWLHLVLALTASNEDMRLFDVQMTTCQQLIDQGIQTVVTNISMVDMSDYAVFPPFEFASLIALQLSRNENSSSLDIFDIYTEYWKTLQSDIEANPLDRSHQGRIICFEQEIEAIMETLDAQQFVLRQAQRGFGASRIGAREDAEHVDATRRSSSRAVGQLIPIDSAAVQSLIIQDNLALVEDHIRGFREMRKIASELGEWNIQKIDSNKDRQEAAIYAFTIVTIIFLPLGTVAGIMGMNTSDVRDMPFGQWVYWATAIPLTILVIALCLAWAGELDNFREGFVNLWRRNPRGYGMIGEGYGGVERRMRYESRDRDRDVAFKEGKRSKVLYGGRGSQGLV